MVDQRIAGYRIIPNSLAHNPRYLQHSLRLLQNDLSDKLIPMLWNAGKYVVDIRSETTPAWQTPYRGYRLDYPLAEPDDIVIEATCELTKVQIQTVTLYQAAPFDYSRMDNADLALHALDEIEHRLRLRWSLKIKPWINRQLRGLFPWQYEKSPPRPKPKPWHQRRDELLRGLFPWQYEEELVFHIFEILPQSPETTHG